MISITMRSNGSDNTSKVTSGALDHADEMIFGKFRSCDSIPLHPFRMSASKTAVIFAGLFCPYQGVQVKEWYVSIATHHDNTVMGESVVQLPFIITLMW